MLSIYEGNRCLVEEIPSNRLLSHSVSNKIQLFYLWCRALCCWKAVEFHFLLGEPMSCGISGELQLHALCVNDELPSECVRLCNAFFCVCESVRMWETRAWLCVEFNCAADAAQYRWILFWQSVYKTIRQCVSVFSRLWKTLHVACSTPFLQLCRHLLFSFP